MFSTFQEGFCGRLSLEYIRERPAKIFATHSRTEMSSERTDFKKMVHSSEILFSECTANQ